MHSLVFWLKQPNLVKQFKLTSNCSFISNKLYWPTDKTDKLTSDVVQQCYRIQLYTMLLLFYNVKKPAATSWVEKVVGGVEQNDVIFWETAANYRQKRLQVLNDESILPLNSSLPQMVNFQHPVSHFEREFTNKKKIFCNKLKFEEGK